MLKQSVSQTSSSYPSSIENPAVISGESGSQPDYTPAVGDVVEFKYGDKMLKAIVYMDDNYGLSLIDNTRICNGEGCFRVMEDCNGIKFRRIGKIDVELTHYSKTRSFAKAYFAKPTFTGSYNERQKQWIDFHGLKVGDQVKVVRKFAKNEDGYIGSSWDSGDKTLRQGKIMTIQRIDSDRIALDSNYWPYFALEPVK